MVDRAVNHFPGEAGIPLREIPCASGIAVADPVLGVVPDDDGRFYCCCRRIVGWISRAPRPTSSGVNGVLSAGLADGDGNLGGDAAGDDLLLDQSRQGGVGELSSARTVGAIHAGD